jgi:hypothetical protein
LQKENKFKAPRGVFIGPYYAFNHMNRGVNWYFNGENLDMSVASDIKLNIHVVGVELGYQFVFWDKLSVDMILLGPGFGSYNLKTVLKSTLTPEEESEFFTELNDYLQKFVPGYNWVYDSVEFKKKGGFNIFEFGYRHSIRIGYRF